jgi:hypothetical protein
MIVVCICVQFCGACWVQQILHILIWCVVCVLQIYLYKFLLYILLHLSVVFVNEFKSEVLCLIKKLCIKKLDKNGELDHEYAVIFSNCMKVKWIFNYIRNFIKLSDWMLQWNDYRSYFIFMMSHVQILIQIPEQGITGL